MSNVNTNTNQMSQDNTLMIERFQKALTREGKSEHTISSYIGTVAKLGRTIELTKATPFDIEDFMDTLKGQSSTTINQRLNALKKFYGYMTKMGVITTDPSEPIDTLKVDDYKKDWTLLTIDDYKDIFAKQWIDLDMRVGIMLSALLGLRTAEICNLKWEHVELSNKVVQVINGKGGKSATLPINNTLYAILEGLNRDGEYVVTNKQGEPMTTKNFQKRFGTLRKQLGLPSDLHIHSGRHTFATHLVKNDVKPVVVQEILRHASYNTTICLLYTSDAADD
jgi:integrase/recombinase XerD